MFRRIMLTALLAGGLAGLTAFGLHAWKLIPLILEAEVYEQTSVVHEHPGIAHEQAAHKETAAGPAAAHEHDSNAWEPENGFERTAYTLLADLLTGVGFASLLAGAMALSGREIGWREGVLWGLAGFASFTLAPLFGLPPELPGMAAADLLLRQVWWWGAAMATAGGIALITFSKPNRLRAIGAALIVLPHVIGAPHGELSSAVPPELVAHFAIASVVAGGAFWVVLGALSGLLFQRLRKA